MITRIRNFFYKHSEKIAVPIAFLWYVTFLVIFTAPELTLELIPVAVVFSVSLVVALAIAVALYDILFRLTLGVAGLLDWIFPQENDPDNDPASDKALQDLIESQITNGTYEEVIIASDLHPYDPADVARFAHHASPYTRETLQEEAPFPYHFAKHTLFVKNPSLTNLIALCTCPVTGTIMTHPMAAHLIYTNDAREQIPFVLVCDASALEALPQHIQLAQNDEDLPQKLHYEQLEAVLNKERIVSKLTKQAALAPHADMATGWERAFREATTRLPSLPQLPDAQPEPSIIPKSTFTYTQTVYTLFGISEYSNHRNGTDSNNNLAQAHNP